MKPILFNTPMVQAILEDRKTVTRRLIKPHIPNRIIKNVSWGTFPGAKTFDWIVNYEDDITNYFGHLKPPYQKGDILYVRETWSDEPEYYYVYKADCPLIWDGEEEGEKVVIKASEIKWRPSIHMPKEAARLFLKVTNVRAERVQDITEEGAINEGIRGWTKDGELYKYGHIAPGDDGSIPWQMMPRTAIEAFKNLWNSTIKRYDYGNMWQSNPWVWAYEFEKASKEAL